MKEHIGKILVALVLIVFFTSFAVVFYAIFSRDTGIDMFVVWAIFVAEGLKNLLKGGWNSAFCFIGTISLFVWAIYFVIRIFSSKEDLDIDLDGHGDISWDKEKEAIFQKYGHVFWKIGVTFWVLSLMMDFVAVSIPTAKQSAVIYIVPKIVNNADMREIPTNLAILANEGLKELIAVVKDSSKEIAEEAIGASKEKAKEAISEVVSKAKEEIGAEEKKE